MRNAIKRIASVAGAVTAGGMALYALYCGCPVVYRQIEDAAVKALARAAEVVTIRREVRIEPEYSEGVKGLVAKYSDLHKVPRALALSVAVQEGSAQAHNEQVNCSNRHWRKQPTIRYCALGMMQMIPAFNKIDNPLEIIGAENLERNIDLGIARLRADYDRAKGAIKSKREADRWYQALIYYYGDEADGYQQKVMARLSSMALENG